MPIRRRYCVCGYIGSDTDDSSIRKWTEVSINGEVGGGQLRTKGLNFPHACCRYGREHQVTGSAETVDSKIK